MEKSLKEKAQASIESIKGKVNALKEDWWDADRQEIIKQFKESGENRASELLENINSYKNVFKDAGYKLDSINLSVALPPNISLTFKCTKILKNSERQVYLEKVENNKMVSIILKSLFKASDYSENIKIGNINCRPSILR